MSHYITKTIRA